MKNSPTQLRWRWCRFDELGVHELQNIYTARQLVFVLEQECAYLDADGVDEQSIISRRGRRSSASRWPMRAWWRPA